MGRTPSSAWAWLIAASTAPMHAAELSSPPLGAHTRVKSGAGATLWPGSGIPVSDSEEGIARSGRSVPTAVAARACFQV